MSKSEIDSNQLNVKSSIDGNFTDLIGANIIENIKPEDLDDTHCRITPE